MSTPYQGNADTETQAGDFRKVVFTSPHSQLTMMTLQPGEDIGAEVHRDGDQIFVVLSGSGTCLSGSNTKQISAHGLLAIPAGTLHNVTNTGSEPMHLATIYSPPQHAPGTVHHTKADAASEKGATSAMTGKVTLTAEELFKLIGKSEETPVVSTVHHPLGTHGLWGTPSKKVPTIQQLPAYIQNTARALMRDHGMEESQAIATAVNAVKAWAAGRAFGGRVKVTPEVQAAAQRAIDEWEKLRAAHH